MKNTLNIGLLSTAEDAVSLFTGLGENYSCTRINAPELSAALDEASDTSDVIMVEINNNLDIDQLEAWKQWNPTARVYALTENADLQDVRKIMRAGAMDVFVRPLPKEEIKQEMERLMTEISETENNGKIISFMNAKGGNGSTTMAVNTAAVLAEDQLMKTLLIDLDIQFGDASASLDLHPVSSVMEALSQSSRLDPSLLHSLVTKHQSGLHVLSSPARLGPLDAIHNQDIHKLLEVTLEMYDVVVVDIPRVITPWTTEVMRWSDHLFLVTQGCIASVRDSHLLQDYFANHGVNMDTLHYILNRAGSKMSGVSEEQMKKSLNSDHVITVRNGFDVASRAADMGKSVVAMDKGSKLSKDIRHLADIISTLCGHEKAKAEGPLGWLLNYRGGRK